VSLLLLCCVVEAGPWQDCGERFRHALKHHDVNGNVSRYLYTKRPGHLLPGGTAPLMVTYEGCRRFCGSGKQWTNWVKVTDSLMTWLLPLGALLLQAPFESNRFWATFFMLARWLGNPIVAIGGSLWNIRITSRCAALLDRSISETMLPGYADSAERLHADICVRMASWFVGGDGVREPQSAPLHGANAFSHLRDSLYILTVLNQFELDYHNYVPDVHAFLRFALFCFEADAGIGNGGDSCSSSRNGSVSSAGTGWGSNASDAAASAGSSVTAVAEPASAPDEAHITAVLRLRDKRAELAEHLRATRKHGVVPVLFSLLAFALALGISVAQAYGQLGSSYSEYNLSLGLLMTWLPVLVACTLLDRNPTNTELTRKELQRFFDSALLEWQAMQQCELTRPFAPLTVDISPNLRLSFSPGDDEGIPLAPTEPLPQPQPLPPTPLPPPPSPTRATQGKPFVLAFSGQVRRKWHRGVAYDIITDMEKKVDNWLTRNNKQRGYLHLFETGDFARIDVDTVRGAGRHSASFFHTVQVWQLLAALLVVGPATFGAFTASYNTPPIGIGCRAGGFMLFSVLAFGGYMIDMLGSWLHHLPPGRPRGAPQAPATPPAKAAARAVRVALTVLEVLTSSFLLMHLLGQTFLLYQTCFCRASMWTGRIRGGPGGYIDFEEDDYYRQHFALCPFWHAGTVLGCAPLVVVLYAVAEWCMQSHLWSIEFAKAMRGLRRVRRVRRARRFLGGALWAKGYAALARRACSVGASVQRRAQFRRATEGGNYGELSAPAP
jgi:hypothetical protein